MKLYRLLHHLTVAHTPIDPSEAATLNTQAETAYNEALQRAKGKQRNNELRDQELAAHHAEADFKSSYPLEKLTLWDNAVLVCENWITQYGFAFAFMFLSRTIADYTAGGEDENKEEEIDEDTIRMMRAMMSFQKFKKQ